MKFIGDMKFSGVSELLKKFNREKGETRFRRRLKQLEDHGFLNTEWEFGGRGKLYMLSQFGVDHLYGLGLTRVQRGQKSIDIRNYEHDREVLRIRLFLEEKFKADNWISDRVLRDQQLFIQGLRPDAVCDIQGKKCAIEFERTRKKRFRIVDIISEYIRELGFSEPKVDVVMFVFRDQKLKEMYMKVFEGLLEGHWGDKPSIQFLLWNPEKEGVKEYRV